MSSYTKGFFSRELARVLLILVLVGVAITITVICINPTTINGTYYLKEDNSSWLQISGSKWMTNDEFGKVEKYKNMLKLHYTDGIIYNAIVKDGELTVSYLGEEIGTFAKEHKVRKNQTLWVVITVFVDATLMVIVMYLLNNIINDEKAALKVKKKDKIKEEP